MIFALAAVGFLGVGMFCFLWQCWAGIHQPYKTGQSSEERLAATLVDLCLLGTVISIALLLLGVGDWS